MTVQCGMVWLSGFQTKAGSRCRDAALSATLRANRPSNPCRSVSPRRAAAGHSRIGWLALAEPNQGSRGSFVTGGAEPAGGVDWNGLLERRDVSLAGPNGGWNKDVISFAVSRPSQDLFPLDEFRATCATVLARRDLADILQLGSPSGYEPLRRHLMEEARRQQVAGPGDDLLITNGCQQALDLIGRVLLRPGDTVAVEDPLYTGLKNLLTGMGAQLCGVPVGADGMDAAQLERVLEREKPRFLVVTSNFQNPTGASLPMAGRKALLDAARKASVPVIENDAYGELR